MPADTSSAPPIVIMNEGLALDLFGVRDVTGRTLALDVRESVLTPPPSSSGSGARLDLVPVLAPTATIVGIVDGAERSTSGPASTSELYVPLDQQPGQDVAILAGGHDDEAPPVGALRR